MQKQKFCQQTPLDGALAQWFKQAPGSRVQERERELLAHLSNDLFGYYLLQIGHLGDDIHYLHNCPIKTKSIISQTLPALPGAPAIHADNHHLPVATDSIDAVILPHTLDFARDPQQVLREVERMLIPEGRVIITGFNPYSLWGLWRLFRKRGQQVPWCGHFLSRRRLEDWLSLLGFDIELSINCEFAPPTKQASTPAAWQTIERCGKNYWPVFGAIYAIKAVKRVSRVRPLVKPWRRLHSVHGHAVEPTTRTSHSMDCDACED